MSADKKTGIKHLSRGPVILTDFSCSGRDAICFAKHIISNAELTIVTRNVEMERAGVVMLPNFKSSARKPSGKRIVFAASMRSN